MYLPLLIDFNESKHKALGFCSAKIERANLPPYKDFPWILRKFLHKKSL